MRSKDPDKTQQKPEPEPPKPLRDLTPKEVSDKDGTLIKGGPNSNPWRKPLT